MALTKVKSGMRTLATDEVTATEIAAGAVDTAEIATDAVTANEIAAGAVAASEIASTFDISSKTVTLPAAAVTAHVTATDIKPLENNIALLGFYRAIDNNKAVYEMQDVVIDNFEDATGVTSSTNGSRDATGEYYSLEGDGTFGYGDSISITWTAFVSGEASPRSVPNLEDNSTAYANGTGATSNWQIQADLGAEYNITGWQGYHSQANGMVATAQMMTKDSAWSTSTWNDGTATINTSSGGLTASTGITSVSGTTINVTNGTGWKKVTFSGVTTRYIAWQNMTTQVGNGNHYCEEVQIFHRSPTNATGNVISTTTTAKTQPTKASGLLMIENAGGTAVLNTDIKMYASRDASTYTQGTLVDEATWGTNKKVLAFNDLDISGQPSGTSMRWKLEWANQATAKNTRIHGVALMWK